MSTTKTTKRLKKLPEKHVISHTLYANDFSSTQRFQYAIDNPAGVVLLQDHPLNSSTT
jgi:hypothetical protein